MPTKPDPSLRSIVDNIMSTGKPRDSVRAVAEDLTRPRNPISWYIAKRRLEAIREREANETMTIGGVITYVVGKVF